MFNHFIKRASEIRKFHVAVVQRRLRNIQKSKMHVQSCCFANPIAFFPFSLPSPSFLLKLPIVVIQKFCYHGNMTSHFSSLLKVWFQTDLGLENSASYYRQGRQLLLTFLTKVTRWSCSTSNFYALIAQNFTGEFMRKIYAASWNLFTLTAEAFNRLFLLEMRFNCYQESSVIRG